MLSLSSCSAGCTEKLDTWCCFCLKITPSSNSVNYSPQTEVNSETNKVTDFIKLLERCTGQKIGNVNRKEDSGDDKWLYCCCEDCLVIINSFCDIYHQIKCLELQLEWKLGSLCSIMQLAGKVPARFAKLKNFFKEMEISEDKTGDCEPKRRKLKTIKQFRNDVITKCLSRLSKSQPRVSLKRWKDKAESQSQEQLATNYSISETDLPVRQISADILPLHSFLGWILSVSAVIFLATTTHEPVNLSQQKSEKGNDEEIYSSFEVDDDEEDRSIRLSDSNDKANFNSSHSQSAEEQQLTGYQIEDLSSLLPGAVTKIEPVYESNIESNLDDEKNTPENMFSHDNDDPGDNLVSDCESEMAEVDHCENENPPQPQQLESVVTETVIESNLEALTELTTRDNKDHPTTQPDTQIEDKIVKTPPRYNLRAKRKRSPVKIEEDSESDDDQLSNLDNGDEESSSSSSDSDVSYTLDTVKPISKRGKKPRLFSQTELGHSVIPKKEECTNEVSETKVQVPANLPMTTHNPSHDTPDKNVNTANAAFKCDPCNRSFNFWVQFQQHILKVHNQHLIHVKKPTKYTCDVKKCGQKFENLEALQQHKKLHETFKCQFCDVTKHYAPELALHEKEHALRAASSTNKTFHCARCPLDFATKARYTRHHVKIHLKISSPDIPKAACAICGVQYIGPKDYLKAHHQTFHNTEGLDPSEILRCDQCAAYFIKGEQLMQHKVRNHFNRKCPDCGKSFHKRPRPSVLRKHIEKNHPLSNAFPFLKFSCDLPNCLRRFGSQAELDQHKIGHPNNVELLQCSKCPKQCKGELAMRAHMNTVHGPRTHVCTECGRSFKAKGALDKHQEFHKDPEEWQFECAECGKKCVDKHKLSQHMRTHSKDKPFVCQFCGEKYAHQHNWKNHMKTKHKKEFEEGNYSGRRLNGNFLSRKGSKKGDCIITGVKQP